MSEKMDNLIGKDELGRDEALREALGLLDPSHLDPNYWLRFRQWVMNNAAAELARRRLMAELTVGDVMTSWARAVLPTAAIAATLAGLLLARAPTVEPEYFVSIEELLISDLEGESIPALLSADDVDQSTVAFASEIF